MFRFTGYRNESAKIAQPEVIQVRTPEVGQHSASSNGVATLDRIPSGLSNINHVNKGPVVISQNGLYGYTDLPPKEFGHVSGEFSVYEFLISFLPFLFSSPLPHSSFDPNILQWPQCRITCHWDKPQFICFIHFPVPIEALLNFSIDPFRDSQKSLNISEDLTPSFPISSLTPCPFC